MTKFFTACAVVIALGPAFVSLGRAQEPEIRIVQLDCNSDPELVVIRNLGDVAQDLTGLELQSDQTENETFVLFGILQPGESTGVELTLQSVFRDDDPSDYARIVDPTGAVVDQVNCGGAAPSPTAAPSPAPPTLSPDALRVVDTPNGGGAPPPAGDVLSPALMMLIGGLTAAAGLGTLTLPWLRPSPSRLTRQSVKLALTVQAPVPWPQPRRETQRDDPERLRRLASGFALAAIAATAASTLLLWRRSG
jgi:hypothetical protein